MSYGRYLEMGIRETFLIVFSSAIAYVVVSSILGIMWIQKVSLRIRRR